MIAAACRHCTAGLQPTRAGRDMTRPARVHFVAALSSAQRGSRRWQSRQKRRMPAECRHPRMMRTAYTAPRFRMPPANAVVASDCGNADGMQKIRHLENSVQVKRTGRSRIHKARGRRAREGNGRGNDAGLIKKKILATALPPPTKRPDSWSGPQKQHGPSRQPCCQLMSVQQVRNRPCA